MELSSIIYDILLPSIGGMAAAVGAIKFLSKKFIEQQLQKDLEDHKSALMEKTEGLKHSLSIYAHERNIQASRIDSQMAASINNVYTAVAQLLQSADKFSNGSPIPVSAQEEYYGHDSQKAREYSYYTEYAEKLKVNSEELETVLLKNAIFIDSVTYNKIALMQQSFLQMSNDYLMPILIEESGRDDLEEIVDELLEMRKKLSDYYNNELSGVMSEIITTFRRQLGTEKI